MRSLTLFLLCCLTLLGNFPLHAEEQRKALIIGNYKYAGHLKPQNSDDEKFKQNKCHQDYAYEKREPETPNDNDARPLSDLPKVLNDACDMREKLRELGFEVRLLLNATKEEMYAAIYYLFNDKEQKFKRNVNLLYFAGHGTDQGEEYYLISSTPHPTCIDRTCFYDKLSVSQTSIYNMIRSMMSPVKKAKNTSKETEDNESSREYNEGRGDKEGIYSESELGNKEYINFIIVDACRDGNKNINQQVLKQQLPDDTFFAFATALNEAAYGNKGDRNGRYTKHLLEWISTPGLPVKDMFEKVNLAVKNETTELHEKAKREKNCKQDNSCPEIQTPHYLSGEVEGESFIFKKESIDQVPHW